MGHEGQGLTPNPELKPDWLGPHRDPLAGHPGSSLAGVPQHGPKAAGRPGPQASSIGGALALSPSSLWLQVTRGGLP